MIATNQHRICDVCRLLDFDCSPKLCSYCGLCSAWICEDDQNRWDRRIKAAIKRRLESGYAGTPDYPEQIQKQLEGKEKNAAVLTASKEK